MQPTTKQLANYRVAYNECNAALEARDATPWEADVNERYAKARKRLTYLQWNPRLPWYRLTPAEIQALM